MKTVGVIPARYASSRFPGKPLAPILGRPMVRWVYERARRVRGLDRVIVATDDRRIFEEVCSFGGEAVMTPAGCPSGTDRVWEASRDLDCDVVLNIQGDEPTLDPCEVERLVELMRDDPGLEMGTMVAPIVEPADLENPNVVKVAMGLDNRCLYFSRSPIPFQREAPGADFKFLWHIGIYAFRKEFLGRFTGWPQGALEKIECLEQLRAIERGVTIRAVTVSGTGCTVDVPEDIPRAEKALRETGEAG